MSHFSTHTNKMAKKFLYKLHLYTLRQWQLTDIDEDSSLVTSNKWTRPNSGKDWWQWRILHSCPVNWAKYCDIQLWYKSCITATVQALYPSYGISIVSLLRDKPCITVTVQALYHSYGASLVSELLWYDALTLLLHRRMISGHSGIISIFLF